MQKSSKSGFEVDFLMLLSWLGISNICIEKILIL